MNKWSVATIGFFDGVHLGHQKLIATVKQLAKDSNLRSLVFTFDKSLKSKELIFSFKKKIKDIKLFKVDKIIVLNFEKIKNLSPKKFFEKFIVKNKVKMIVIGSDFRFGKNASGDVDLLISLAKKHMISVAVIKDVKVKINNKNYSVSSSLIRDKIKKSKFKEVKNLLGKDYYIEGKPVSGYKIGSRFLEVPTLNIKPDGLALPKGVILGITEIDKKKFFSIANFGYSPTFDFKKREFLVEIHILGEKNIKAKNNLLKFYPIKKIRNEKKFSSIFSLKERIMKDIKIAYDFFKTYKGGN
ncbi:MAG: riboflavin biosynthesis protein RibF [Endomicrobia bacterium]|nr:riboflavin biosynthesis protein RibF [Endomicrobiia bacterium]